MNQREIAMFAREAREGAQRWLATVRTPGMPLGYFRFSRHARHPWGLYASNSALVIYSTLGLTGMLTPEEKQGWARIFLDRYHPRLGLFLCPQLYGDVFRGDPANHDDRVRADAAAPFKKVAATLFELTGSLPSTPDEGTLGFDDIEALERFMETKRRELVPYSFGSALGDFFHRRTLWLRGQGRDVLSDPWIRWGYSYVERIRDPRTAMVTGSTADPVSQMNGLFKLSCSTFWGHGVPMPRARTVVDQVLTLLDPAAGFGQACEDYNATLLLCRLSMQEEGYRRGEILDVVGGPILARLKARRRADGGFSFHTDHCLTRVNFYDVCDPLPESDLFGTGQQLAILKELAALLDI